MRGRKEIFDEIEAQLGRVPGWMITLPEATLEHEWEIMKAMEMTETRFSPVQKHLMASAIATALGCWHAQEWHSRMAIAMGATDAQVGELGWLAKHVAGWSLFLDATNPDREFFKKETQEIADHVKQSQKKAA